MQNFEIVFNIDKWEKFIDICFGYWIELKNNLDLHSYIGERAAQMVGESMEYYGTI